MEVFMNFLNIKASFFVVFFVLITSITVSSQDINQVIEDTKWIEGPGTADIGGIAEIYVPLNYVFANEEDTKSLMTSMGNALSGNEIGFFAPYTLEWFAVFEFSEIGYVSDEEKDELDADELMEIIREGNEEANEFREENGFGKLFIDGWEMKPNYNEKTNNLEWAIRGIDEYGYVVLNHSTRLLGRKGVMEVTLVAGDSSFADILKTYQSCLDKYSYSSGNKYAEYREGDKLYEYGLTGLVVGGGAALAAKSGLFKYLWKIIVGIFIAVSSFFKKLFPKFKKAG